MNRREVLDQLGASGAGLAMFILRSLVERETVPVGRTSGDAWSASVLCSLCTSECKRGLRYSTQKVREGAKAYQEVLDLCAISSEVCGTTHRLFSRSRTVLPGLCEACAEGCERLAAACDRLGDDFFAPLADVARRCAATCRRTRLHLREAV